MDQKPPTIDAEFEVISGPREAIEGPESAQRQLDREFPELKGWRLALAVILTTAICLPMVAAAYWFAHAVGDPIGKALVRALH